MSRPVCYDLINLVFVEVGYLKQEQKNRENMNKVLDEIKRGREDTVVYYYRDGEGNQCPYFIYEFGCAWNEDEDEDD
jgi:hypothetical protein